MEKLELAEEEEPDEEQLQKRQLQLVGITLLRITMAQQPTTLVLEGMGQSVLPHLLEDLAMVRMEIVAVEGEQRDRELRQMAADSTKEQKERAGLECVLSQHTQVREENRMVRTKAVVQPDGLVVNRIAVPDDDDSFEVSGHTLVLETDATGNAFIAGTWDGSKFVPPKYLQDMFDAEENSNE